MNKFFLNLQVADLQRAQDFYTSLGFTINPIFTDETGACIVLSETLFVMLLTPEKFAQFITKPVADSHTTQGGLYAFQLPTKEGVHTIMAKGLEAGGTEVRPRQDHGFMMSRALDDLDGHTRACL